MKTLQGWPVGFCSWSLRAPVEEVIRRARELGVSHVHLAVGPAIGDLSYIRKVRESGLTVTSAMIDFPQEDYSTLDSIRVTGGLVPDAPWPANRERFRAAADAAAELGTPYLSMHAGFIDHTDALLAHTLCDRLLDLAEIAASRRLTLLLETGQESANDLRHLLEDLRHPMIAVNFDPANMILYNKDNPLDAVRTLAPWIRHVHIKDAVRTKTPGQWGAEVAWGDGEVGGEAFLSALRKNGFDGALAVEREAGEQRFEDIRTALKRLGAE